MRGPRADQHATMNARATLIKQLVEDGSYPIDEAAIAEAILVRAMARRVVPEIASRAHLTAIVPVVERALADASADGTRDIDAVAGKRCTFQGFPWKWHEGDACVIRLVAIIDPSGNYRLESGQGS